MIPRGYNSCDIANFKSLRPDTKFTCSSDIGCEKKDIKEIIFKLNNVVNFFPQIIDEKFKNIHAITMISVSLLEVTSDNLKPFKELIYLNLDTNLLRNIPKNLFQHNSKLETIILNNNRIQSIHSTVFNDLSNLKNLELRNNICISNIFSNHEKLSIQILRCIEAQKFDSEVQKFDSEIRKFESEAQKCDCNLSYIFNVIQFFIITLSILIVGLMKLKSSLTRVKNTKIGQNTIVELVYSVPRDFDQVPEVIYNEPIH